MNSVVVLTGAGVVGLIVVIKLLIWYFNSTVCIKCYDRVRTRHAKSAEYRNKDMYLCQKC